jgi:Ca-activated chloride channel family protein
VSRISGGRSYTARNANRVTDVYKTLGSSLGRKTELREISSWFATAAAALLITAIALARHWSPPLP